MFRLRSPYVHFVCAHNRWYVGTVESELNCFYVVVCVCVCVCVFVCVCVCVWYRKMQR
jgi:hypothetical protein